MLGAVGLFLLGMGLMTRSLQAMAGPSLRRILARVTRSPASGALAGSVTTAIVQSSSATTIAAVGFVGAGLLTFPQALGIVFGANIGTTLTGWLVALLGLKFGITQLVAIMIFVGALLRAFARGRVAEFGLACAGFGLVFLGIDVLREGLEGLEGGVTPESFPPDTGYGRLLLVLIGMGITLVTQSSSAGVATALTAVHSGTISLAQAGALVIGMDISTAFSAALATVGGNLQARRTGFAHVVFNLLTGVGAILLLSPFLWLANDAVPSLGANPEIALAAFHTAFNLLGVVAVLPFAAPFTRLMERLFPEREQRLTRALDRRLAEDPGNAIDAAATASRAIAARMFERVCAALDSGGGVGEGAETETRAAIREVRKFVTESALPREGSADMKRRLRVFHVLDHLARLERRLAQTERAAAVREDDDLARTARALREAAKSGREILESDHTDVASVRPFEQAWRSAADTGDEFRQLAIQRAQVAGTSLEELGVKLDASRWLRRVGHHCWRIARHLDKLSATEERAKQTPTT